MFSFSLQHRLDIDDRRSVDRFDRSNTQAIAVDRVDDDGMETERVRPVRGPRRENAGERIPFVGSRVDLKNIAPCTMKPGDDDDLVANGDTLSPSAAHERTSSHASGAPSRPCFGALLRALSADRIVPTGRSRPADETRRARFVFISDHGSRAVVVFTSISL